MACCAFILGLEVGGENEIKNTFEINFYGCQA